MIHLRIYEEFKPKQYRTVDLAGLTRFNLFEDNSFKTLTKGDIV